MRRGAAWERSRAATLGALRGIRGFPLEGAPRECAETARSRQLSPEEGTRRARCHGDGDHTRNGKRNPQGAQRPGGVARPFARPGAEALLSQVSEQWCALGRDLLRAAPTVPAAAVQPELQCNHAPTQARAAACALL